MTTTLWTAASDNLVAVIHDASIGHSRLSIPLYSNGELQSTLTCALPSSDQPVLVQKLQFSSPHYVCVLFSQGTIVVWNVTRGVVVHTIQLSQDVYDITSNNTDKDSLFVLTSKKNKLYVNEYSLITGKVVRKIKSGMHMEKNGKASLAVSEEYVAVRLDEKIKILSLENGSKVTKLKLKSSGDGSLMAMHGSKIAIATSTGLVLYSLTTPETPVGHVFLHQQPIHSLQLTSSNMILVESQVSSALYQWPSSTTQTEPLTHITTISTLPNVETARFVFSNEHDNHLVAVLHSASKGIHVVPRVSFQGENKVLVGFPLEQDDDTTKTTSSLKRNKQSVTTTLGPGQAGGEALQASDRPVKRAKTNTEEEQDVSIAERLRQLAQEMEREEEEEEEEQSASKPPSFHSKRATTESLFNLLKQALRSGDEAMLELSLGVRDKRVIGTSLQQLDAALVELLLTKLTTRLVHKPNRAAELSVWISLVLESGKIHETQHLRPLRNLLQERAESFPHLLKLEGRLSVLAP